MKTSVRLSTVLTALLTLLTFVLVSPVMAKRDFDNPPGKSGNAPGHANRDGGGGPGNSPGPADDGAEDDADDAVEDVDAEDEVEDEEEGGPGKSAYAPGHAKRLAKGATDTKGNLRTSQHIYYEGDVIEVFIKFPRGWELLADGTVEAYVVVISPETDLVAFPVDPAIGPTDRSFFYLPLESSETLLVGQYQLGLVLVQPGGDPANVGDWYNGFRGLTDVEGILISDQFLPEDADMDGECDFDADGDGFCDPETGTDDDDDTDDDAQDPTEPTEPSEPTEPTEPVDPNLPT